MVTGGAVGAHAWGGLGVATGRQLGLGGDHGKCLSRHGGGGDGSVGQRDARPLALDIVQFVGDRVKVILVALGCLVGVGLEPSGEGFEPGIVRPLHPPRTAAARPHLQDQRA
mgnify:CR=1 FL=1